jgi:ABC-type uncharacterized transport system permease subunit
VNPIRYLEKRIRGLLPKSSILTRTHRIEKPRWWRPLWIASLLGIIISALVLFLSGYVPLERMILGLVISFFCIGVAYYIRVKPSMKVNRALYVLLGITPIGFSLWMVLALSGLGRWLTNMVGAFPSLIIGWVVCLGIGALIGDWLGKRRNYQLPLSP